MAEREGFEPPEACASPVFKTGTLNHSDISPVEEGGMYKLRLIQGKTILGLIPLRLPAASHPAPREGPTF
jgi:hypothetical protein